MSSLTCNVKLSSEEHMGRIRRARRARQAEWNSSFRAPAYVKGDTMIVGGIGVCLRFAGVNLLGSIDHRSLGESRPGFQGKMKNSQLFCKTSSNIAGLASCQIIPKKDRRCTVIHLHQIKLFYFVNKGKFPVNHFDFSERKSIWWLVSCASSIHTRYSNSQVTKSYCFTLQYTVNDLINVNAS